MTSDTPKQPQHPPSDHSPEAIIERLSAGPNQIYLKDFIYGAIDGGITTFAVVSGVSGAGLSSGIIIILGIANLLADGFSMGISNFLGTRAENQHRERIREEEHQEILSHPDGEREEIRQIYARKGFSGELLEKAVNVITADREQWVDTMMQEEHGISLLPVNAVKAGLITFVAFILIGVIPLLTFLINWVTPGAIAQPFLWSSILTLISFFIVGVTKGHYITHSWLRAGLETLIIGTIAAALAYGIGYALQGLIETT